MLDDTKPFPYPVHNHTQHAEHFQNSSTGLSVVKYNTDFSKYHQSFSYSSES